MAAKKKTVYKQQAETSKITATSRVAVKIGENYYTVEAHEERTLPVTVRDLNMEKEWAMLWDSVNSVADGQVEDIIKTFSKK